MLLFLARSLEFAAKGNQDVQEDDRQPSLISAVAAGLLSECSGKAKCMAIIPAADRAYIPTPLWIPSKASQCCYLEQNPLMPFTRCRDFS